MWGCEDGRGTLTAAAVPWPRLCTPDTNTHKQLTPNSCLLQSGFITTLVTGDLVWRKKIRLFFWDVWLPTWLTTSGINRVVHVGKLRQKVRVSPRALWFWRRAVCRCLPRNRLPSAGPATQIRNDERFWFKAHPTLNLEWFAPKRVLIKQFWSNQGFVDASFIFKTSSWGLFWQRNGSFGLNKY